MVKLNLKWLFGIEKKEEVKLDEAIKTKKPLPNKKIKISMVPKVNNPSYSFKPRPGITEFEQPEYDLGIVGRVEDTDSYVRRAFSYKKGLMFKEGWEFTGKNPKTIRYYR